MECQDWLVVPVLVVLVSFKCHLATTWDHWEETQSEQLTGSRWPVGLPLGSVLIDGGRPSLWWMVLLHGLGSEVCKTKEKTVKASRTQEARKGVLISPCC